MPLTASDIAGLLKAAKRNTNGSYQARCPAHEDDRPSLSIADGDKGVILYCHAGCSFEEVCAKLNVNTADLMQPSEFWDRHFSDTATLSVAEFLKSQTGVSIDLPESLLQPESVQSLNIASIAPFDPEGIPRKIWLHGNSILAGKISILAGHGGRGKSLLALHRIVAVASGTPITGAPIRKTKVWLISLEDDFNDLRERLTGISIGHNIEQTDYAENLMVTGFENWFTNIDGKSFGEIVQLITVTIKTNGIGLLVIDPLAHFLNIDENDNREMSEFMKYIQAIARETVCAILLIHHSRKTLPGVKTDGLDLRGASAIHAHARIVEIVNRIPEAEAEAFGLDGIDKKNVVRLENDKGNFSELTDSVCYRFEPHELPNGGISPSMHRIITDNSMNWFTLDMQIQCWEIASVRIDLRESSRANLWCGKFFSEPMELNHSLKPERAKIKQAIDYMLETGILRSKILGDKEVVIAGRRPA